MSQPIYLDYHSTTPVDPRIAEKVCYYMTTGFANANSRDHIYGNKAQEAVKIAKKQIAELLNCGSNEIIFTSGATESINLVIQGLIYQISGSKLPRIIVSPVEHKAVLDTCNFLSKKELAEIICLKIDEKARLNLEYLEEVCAYGASLLCVMAANNEVGNIYPIKEIGAIAHKYKIPFLCDGSQAVGKILINFENWNITFLTISGHKIYAPQGIGALIIKKGHHLQPLIYGGGHQKGLRSGTLNLPGIVGLGEACYLRNLEMEKDEKAIAILRNQLQQLLQEKIPQLVINGDTNNKLAGNLHISIPNIPNSAIIARIRDKLAISTGAACSSLIEAPSHVLTAMNLQEDLIESALRIGLGKFTTETEIKQSADIIAQVIEDILILINN